MIITVDKDRMKLTTILETFSWFRLQKATGFKSNEFHSNFIEKSI